MSKKSKSKNTPKTFAERAKEIMKKYGFNEKTGKFLRGNDPISMSSMNMELSKLREEQEVEKAAKEASDLRAGIYDPGMLEGMDNPMGEGAQPGQQMMGQGMMQEQSPMGGGEMPMMRDGGMFPGGDRRIGYLNPQRTYQEDPHLLGMEYEDFGGPPQEPFVTTPRTTHDLPASYSNAYPMQKGFMNKIGGNLKESFNENPYLWSAAGAQVLGTAAKAAYFGSRDKYTPEKFTPTELPAFEAIDSSEAVKGIRGAAAGAKGNIRSGTGSRGELYGNLGSLNADEMRSIGELEERTAMANAAAKNQHNMQVAQIKMQDAERKLKIGLINKQAYDQITANWMGIMNESVSGLAGISRDAAAMNHEANLMRLTGAINYGTHKDGTKQYRTVITKGGSEWYKDDKGKIHFIMKGDDYEDIVKKNPELFSNPNQESR